jgi:acetyl-CoA carboxylase biotin carboxyl carrier protein|tara:strand:+ start:501 stop:911 length:411 start_codon:yes stop_codon:yes gene_type:complete
MKIDKKLIKELKEYLDEFDLTEIEYQDGNKKIKVGKNITSGSTITAHKAGLTKSKEEESGTKIISPIIGTAYLAPEPGGKKFIEVGQKIKKGQTVMIVEAMKTMNHVPSTSDGEVKKILVQDGQAVEFGQVLVLLK